MSHSWKLLGKNILGEWVEENADGYRRVFTHNGYIKEPPYKNIRWARVTSQQDADLIAQSLTIKPIFESYKNLQWAYSVYITKIGNVTQLKKLDKFFQKLFEIAIAEKVWNSFIQNIKINNIPNIENTLNRFGLNDWPLFIDIGIYRLLKDEWFCSSALRDYHSILKEKIKNGLIKIIPQNTDINNKSFISNKWTQKKSSSEAFVTYFIDKKWQIKINKKAIKNLSTNKLNFTKDSWIGKKPQRPIKNLYVNQYVPFSDENQTPSGYVSTLLNQAQNKAKPTITATQILKEIRTKLKLSEDQLLHSLSYDQIDAVWLALKQLNNNCAFLLADETGYGKGRTLAAISKIALKSNIRILFFTEKKNLFSDFYRDCFAVFYEEIIPPFILHATAKILDFNGNEVFKKNKGSLIKNSPDWVWTTYSQFNRNNKKKMDSLVKWLKERPTWIIMDESQNAAGNSNTSKVMNKLQKLSDGVVFSSATFAKNEEQLKAYKPLFQGQPNEWNKLLSSFYNGSDLLRLSITLMWAERGIFLRREHPPVLLPNPIWIKNDDKILEQESHFSAWWNEMLSCAKVWSSLNHASASPWKRIGSPLYRASREFSILQKVPNLIEEVAQSIKKEQKPVITSDWNFASHVARFFETHEEKDIKKITLHHIPLWKDSWKHIIYDLFPDEEIEQSNFSVRKKMKASRDIVLEKLNNMKSWSISPFDEIIDQLQRRSIKVAEISGRQHVFSYNKEKNIYLIKKKRSNNRFETVQEFNNGEFDCLLLTRAGNSGISLHAGEKFKDQKQRHLIELDVSPDPSVRVQFWGRVRRKDQVVEPQKSIILIDTPYEKKRFERDNHKQKKLYLHSGRNTSQNIEKIINKEGSFIAKKWLQEHKDDDNRLSVWPDYPIEKILSRSVILNEDKKINLLTHLDRGIKLLDNWCDISSNNFLKENCSIRKKWWWGTNNTSLYWEEVLWGFNYTPQASDVKKELDKHINGKSLSLKQALQKWKEVVKNNSQNNQLTSLSWWIKNINLFERGCGISVNDPLLGGRTRAIILGVSIPEEKELKYWSDTQIGIWIWLVSLDKPIHISLSALLSKQYAYAKPLKFKPSSKWFSGLDFPLKAMVLTGPSWCVSSWASKYTHQGKLLELTDQLNKKKWGYVMPSTWSWEFIDTVERELASLKHFFEFIRRFSDEQVVWRWSPDETIQVVPQSGEFYLIGSQEAIEKLTFNQLKKCSAIRWEQNHTFWNTRISLYHAKSLFYQWYHSGGIPTISPKFNTWYEETFAKFY